jgi:signal transduction histidine kinase/ActR/RegA family two-component response regulator
MRETWMEDDTLASAVLEERAPTADELSACIVHVSENNSLTRTRVLDQDELTIGRGAECTLVIPVGHVSRVHATIRREGDGWAVYDNQSVNGILVNGVRRKFAQLSFGDRIDLGRGELLLYRPYDSDYQRALEAQKLEAIGCLASGIAHDFNNVLMAIVGATAGLYEDIVSAGDQLEDSESSLRTITDIMAATERGADLARQLLSFAKRGGSSTDLVDIGSLVEEVARLVGRTFDQQIVVTTHTNTNATVVGGRSQISQVVMNLCINARDAMPHGGELTVSVEDCPPPKGASSGQYVCLTVTDSGVGMSEDVRDRIFEPFFTTKGEGTGTGLGMSTAYGIVKKNGGTIEVESEVGKGTTISVILPAQGVRTAESERVTANVRARNPHVEGNGRAILLAEDQQLVRRHTSRLLRRMGFEVIECVDGIEAVDAVKNAEKPIALAMLDLQMPRRSGDEACRMIMTLDANLPVIMVSGNTQDPRIEALVDSGEVDVLSKPYGLNELTLALGQAREVEA